MVACEGAMLGHMPGKDGKDGRRHRTGLDLASPMLTTPFTTVYLALAGSGKAETGDLMLD